MPSANHSLMDAELTAVVAEWARLFNAERYYEAHEVAEERWHRSREPERTFLKGLIHAAVSLCHLQRGNAHGARVKHQSAARYLSAYAPRFAGLDVGALTADLDRFMAPLHAPQPEWPVGTPPQARLE